MEESTRGLELSNLASFSRALETLAVLRHQVSLWVDPEKAMAPCPGRALTGKRGPKGKGLRRSSGSWSNPLSPGAHLGLWELPFFRNRGCLGGRGLGGLSERLRRGCGL